MKREQMILEAIELLSEKILENISYIEEINIHQSNLYENFKICLERILLNFEKQNNLHEKEQKLYLSVTFLSSSTITDTHEFLLTAYNKKGYRDLKNTYEYYSPSFLLDIINSDLEFLKSFPQKYSAFELQEIKFELVKLYYISLISFFSKLIAACFEDGVFFIFLNTIDIEVMYGPFMGTMASLVKYSVKEREL